MCSNPGRGTFGAFLDDDRLLLVLDGVPLLQVRFQAAIVAPNLGLRLFDQVVTDSIYLAPVHGLSCQFAPYNSRTANHSFRKNQRMENPAFLIGAGLLLLQFVLHGGRLLPILDGDRWLCLKLVRACCCTSPCIICQFAP